MDTSNCLLFQTTYMMCMLDHDVPKSPKSPCYAIGRIFMDNCSNDHNIAQPKNHKVYDVIDSIMVKTHPDPSEHCKTASSIYLTESINGAPDDSLSTFRTFIFKRCMGHIDTA